MITKIKYIGLALGLFSIIISSIFYALQQETYRLLVVAGFLVSLVFFLIILFSKSTIKSKIILITIVLTSIVIQWLTQPLLVKTSYSIFLYKNSNELTLVNNILSKKAGEISISKDEVRAQNNILTQTEKDNLIKLRKKLNVYMVVKSENGIYYGIWGFLDVRLGITYLSKNGKLHISHQHLKDNWYY